MAISRRGFLASLAGAGLAYGFRFERAQASIPATVEPLVMDVDDVCVAADKGINYTEWLVFGPGSKVTAFTGRTELGQGLETVLYAILSQGLGISRKKIRVIMGDTDLCPDDGATTGSSSTRTVGWGFWLACDKVRADLVSRGAAAMGAGEDEVRYGKGSVVHVSNSSKKVNIFDLGRGEAVLMTVDPTSAPGSSRVYYDLGIRNVLSKRIVTGFLPYAGDIKRPGMLYGAFLTPPYHKTLTYVESADLEGARSIPGVVAAENRNGQVSVIGESYTAVRKGLQAVEAVWAKPARPRSFNNEAEIRSGAKLQSVVEQTGDVEAGLAESDYILSETYTTQYAGQCQIETDTAVAGVGKDGKATVWVSSQGPFKQRKTVAQGLRVPESKVHIIGMRVGGGFGGKISNTVAAEAARMSRIYGKTIKYVYSRRDQFIRRGRFKESCVIDLTTGVRTDGHIIARKINLHQDAGKGTVGVYDIPNSLTKLYKAKMPVGHATMRGTSYVQNCFAVESHVDEVAHGIGMDPFRFRRINAALPAFRDLLDAAGEMFGYDAYTPPADHGAGVAVVHHCASELAAMIVEVAVDRKTGKVQVVRVCAAFDVGTVINRRTLTVGVRGAIMWGIGYALKEEIKINGHQALISSMAEYKIPRFSDLPDIEIKFLDIHKPGAPRGCGEIPVVPTIPAIANAVRNAVGIRFRSTPITPEKVLRALR